MLTKHLKLENLYPHQFLYAVCINFGMNFEDASMVLEMWDID